MTRFAMIAVLVCVSLACAMPVEAADQSCENCLGGGADAPIKIEVFSDFQCPACRTLYMDTMKQVLKDYCRLDKVCVIYHEFPLAMHPHAREAARYSLAARKLGRSQWLAVLDSLYADQAIWSQNGMVQVSVARVLSPLDYQNLQKLLQDPSINETIARDIALGQERKVQSTPTMFVTAIGKEQRVDGGLPYPVLKDFFDKIVK
jgi:protein-disulfide isomerase